MVGVLFMVVGMLICLFYCLRLSVYVIMIFVILIFVMLVVFAYFIVCCLFD